MGDVVGESKIAEGAVTVSKPKTSLSAPTVAQCEKYCGEDTRFEFFSYHGKCSENPTNVNIIFRKMSPESLGEKNSKIEEGKILLES